MRLFSPQRPPVLPFKYTCSLVVLTGLLSSQPFCPFCHLLMLFFTGSNNFLCCVQLNLRPAHLSVCHNIVTPCVCVQIMSVCCLIDLDAALGTAPFLLHWRIAEYCITGYSMFFPSSVLRSCFFTDSFHV